MGDLKQSTKLDKLLNELLPQNGVDFIGSSEELLGIIENIVPEIPEPFGDSMQRYYLDGETVKRTEEGKHLSTDSRFYQNNMAGRGALITVMRMIINRPEVLLNLIENRYTLIRERRVLDND